MLIGYKVSRFDAEFAAANKLGLIRQDDETSSTDDYGFDPNECQDLLEKLGSEIGVSYHMLGFDEIAFVVAEMQSTSLKDLRTQLRAHTKKLRQLAQILTEFGIDTDVEEAELITPPEWTRHGICTNYE